MVSSGAGIAAAGIKAFVAAAVRFNRFNFTARRHCIPKNGINHTVKETRKNLTFHAASHSSSAQFMSRGITKEQGCMVSLPSDKKWFFVCNLKVREQF